MRCTKIFSVPGRHLFFHWRDILKTRSDVYAEVDAVRVDEVTFSQERMAYVELTLLCSVRVSGSNAEFCFVDIVVYTHANKGLLRARVKVDEEALGTLNTMILPCGRPHRIAWTGSSHNMAESFFFFSILN